MSGRRRTNFAHARWYAQIHEVVCFLGLERSSGGGR
jgi:hypothetical protein